MQTIQTLLLVLQVFVALALIVFILIQHGKGADAGAAFGSGASSTVFGARGSGNFLTRTTAVLAIIFLGNSLLLGYLSSNAVKPADSLLDSEPAGMMQQKNDLPPAPETAGAPVEATTDAVSAADAAGDTSAATAPADMSSDVPAIPEATEPPASDVPAVPQE